MFLKAGIEAMIVSPIRIPPANGSPSWNWTVMPCPELVEGACAGPVFLMDALIVIVSPCFGVGLKKTISFDVIERFGLTDASARRAKAVL